MRTVLSSMQSQREDTGRALNHARQILKASEHVPHHWLHHPGDVEQLM